VYEGHAGSKEQPATGGLGEQARTTKEDGGQTTQNAVRRLWEPGARSRGKGADQGHSADGYGECHRQVKPSDADPTWRNPNFYNPAADSRWQIESSPSPIWGPLVVLLPQCPSHLALICLAVLAGPISS
jgi:hypothetical protein